MRNHPREQDPHQAWKQFHGEDNTFLDIVPATEVIRFCTGDTGNESDAIIPRDEIWDVIDYLIEIAGPRAFAS